jgi:hypothetical protein
MAATSGMNLPFPFTAIVGLARLALAAGQCFEDESTNAWWARIINRDDAGGTEFSVEGSCCQEVVCAVPCAKEVLPPATVSVRAPRGGAAKGGPKCASFLHLIAPPPPRLPANDLSSQGYGIAIMVAIALYVTIGFVISY